MTQSQPSHTSARADARVLLVGMVVFEGFELLDVFGPLEMFGMLRDRVRIVMLADHAGQAASSGGPAVVVDHTFADAPALDVLIVPGGMGTRREVDNPSFIAAIRQLAQRTPHVASVCTGSAVLAKTGLLDGHQATTNKRAYQWATSQGPDVRWVRQARWVEDGKYFTSSGVSAGIDMSLALIERLFGKEAALQVAHGAEYEWNQDPHHDPFAKANGLVD
ncbi:DJ-1/PfpI family protein [Bordetella genomosp. 13]|uniref:DJ-1/PfpI family protein n=1 Tax=Bordetella genomosp. 13 TaxID=463040 RepID=UPI001C92E7C7|nr:DJ-1/PfpI family protein [Bordetella genomosp. 13]